MILVGCVICVAACTAGPADIARIESSLPSLPPWDEATTRLLADASDGRLDRFSLIDAALVAEGVYDPLRRERLQRLLENHAGDTVIPPMSDSASPLQAAYAVFHKRLLTGGYHAAASRVETALEQGRYNCLSATILFCEFCRLRGLSTTAVASPGHVFCRVRIDDEWLSVETTCPVWAEATRRAIDSDVACLRKDDDRASRALTPSMLVGKVFYNRGVALLAERRFESAIRVLAAGVRLDPTDAGAMENLLAALNNWALDLADNDQFQPASQAVLAGLALNADYPPLRDNDLHVHQRWTVALCNAGEFARAAELVNEGFRRRPEAALFDSGRLAVYQQWVDALFEQGDVNQAFAVLAQASGNLPDRLQEASEQEARLIHTHALRLMKLGRIEQAQRLWQRGTALQPENRLLHADEKLTSLRN